MSRSTVQGFKIQNFIGEIDACASFWINGVEISFSSIGYSEGSCLNEIVVFNKNEEVIKTFRGTVEDAVKWVFQNINV